MIGRSQTCQLEGLETGKVLVEAEILKGFPAFYIVGLAGPSVQESKDRIRSAFHSSGLSLPPEKIIINLYPGSQKKTGSHWDLAIAMALMMSMGKVSEKEMKNAVFIGELGLDGSLRASTGTLAMVLSLAGKNCSVFFPKSQKSQCASVQGLNLYPVEYLSQIVEHFQGGRKIQKLAYQEPREEEEIFPLDYQDLKRQRVLKRIMMIAAAGRHPTLLIGPPGVGKTMALNRLPGILIPLNKKEREDLALIRSLAENARLESAEKLFSSRPPFRAPHYSLTVAGLTGGGNNWKPGELTLAHHGVLFLDELSLFSREVLDSLRGPMESKKLILSRNHRLMTMPSDFMLVAAMNPCPCGYYGTKVHSCSCSPSAILRYRRKISQALLDRFDMIYECPSVDWKKDQEDGLTSSRMREKVKEAFERSQKRNKILNFRANHDLQDQLEEDVFRLEKNSNFILGDLCRKYSLSGRVRRSILKTARTISDLEGEEEIGEESIYEALQYRLAALKFWEI